MVRCGVVGVSSQLRNRVALPEGDWLTHLVALSRRSCSGECEPAGGASASSNLTRAGCERRTVAPDLVSRGTWPGGRWGTLYGARGRPPVLGGVGHRRQDGMVCGCLDAAGTEPIARLAAVGGMSRAGCRRQGKSRWSSDSTWCSAPAAVVPSAGCPAVAVCFWRAVGESWAASVAAPRRIAGVSRLPPVWASV